jgi:hypothetical protein
MAVERLFCRERVPVHPVAPLAGDEHDFGKEPAPPRLVSELGGGLELGLSRAERAKRVGIAAAVSAPAVR